VPDEETVAPSDDDSTPSFEPPEKKVTRMSAPLLSMTGVSKGFPGVQALDDVNLEVSAGEVLVLVGENGAGKSSLMKILSGIYTKDSGQILLDGKEIEITSPHHAQELGITIIHQEMNLMNHLTIAQNIWIGREPSAWGLLSERKLNAQTKAFLADIGVKLNERTIVGELSVAQQQMVEIAKALSFDARVLIMDEPTSALTQAEVDTLFRLIEQLKAKGTAIIYISHRMDELARLADRVSVLRDGKYIGTLDKSELDISTVIEMMVGRHIDEGARPEVLDFDDAPIVLSVEGLSTKNLLRNVGFQLRRGEILAFAGLMGSGRTETARALIGADPSTGGQVSVNGTVATIRQPADAVQLGIGYLSEDRKALGLMLEQNVTFNTALASIPDFTGPLGIIRDSQMNEVATQQVATLKVKTPSINQTVKLLSGGNQQKIVITKWLVRNCDILIFDEPTRGIDVGAKEEIYSLLRDLAATGKSIIMISSELPEVLRVANRIIVMANGRVTGTLRNEEATQEKIMLLATHSDREDH
jgi:ribose transport system ATP-binding protein